MAKKQPQPQPVVDVMNLEVADEPTEMPQNVVDAFEQALAAPETPAEAENGTSPAEPVVPTYTLGQMFEDVQWVYRRERNGLSRQGRSRLYRALEYLRVHRADDLL